MPARLPLLEMEDRMVPVIKSSTTLTCGMVAAAVQVVASVCESNQARRAAKSGLRAVQAGWL